MNRPRFKIVSRVMPSTGRRRWHLQMIHARGASTLTTKATHSEAVEAMGALAR